MKTTRIVSIGAVGVLSLALFGWGVVAGADDVMGIVARSGDAAIIVSDQPEANGVVMIDKVVSPRDAFVVVHQSDGGMPGERLGYASVKAGVSRNVKVELDSEVALTPQLLAAVHVDRGNKGELDFDMDNLERSADKPFFVDGKEVAAAFKAANFGVPTSMDAASISAGDQPLGDSVVIDAAMAPAPAFVVVHKAKADGMPGERIGYTAIPEGESLNVKVVLSKKLDGTTKLLAAIHADLGTSGKLEFDMDDPVASPDQPYFAEGMEVATGFKVGSFGVPVDAASIEAIDQLGAETTIEVANVDAPANAWIVVHKDAGGMPGERVGLAPVSAGQASDVEVKLTTDMLSEKLFVALHADLGTADRFDFDMADKLGSADQPYFVDGGEVAVAIKVREFGYPVPAGAAAISVSDQIVQNGLLRVATAAAPEDAWIVVHLDAGGAPGGRVGLLHIPAGVTLNRVVQLDASKMLTDTLFVAVHADRGEQGLFEFDMNDKVNSPDQPFFVDGAEVATAVTIR